VTILILMAAAWAFWLYPFVFRAPHGQKREHVTLAAPTRLGLLLECTAIAIAFLTRDPEPRVQPLYIVAAAVLFVIANVLGWTSVAHLGKQFRVHAGLYVDHELVRTGPYGVVRHPIYASFLGMLLFTIVLLTPWHWAAVALVFYVAGTEIRVRTEDRLLAGRFGDEFERYRKAVPAYLPFVR
jgi:protein-S-isoprenylcysteine O-methyltransferase Ste14